MPKEVPVPRKVSLTLLPYPDSRSRFEWKSEALDAEGIRCTPAMERHSCCHYDGLPG